MKLTVKQMKMLVKKQRSLSILKKERRSLYVDICNNKHVDKEDLQLQINSLDSLISKLQKSN